MRISYAGELGWELHVPRQDALAVFDALRDGLDDTEILELTYITCTYDMHATMSRALRLEYDDVDDPITEVPAPEGAATDVMAAVDAADS